MSFKTKAEKRAYKIGLLRGKKQKKQSKNDKQRIKDADYERSMTDFFGGLRKVPLSEKPGNSYSPCYGHTTIHKDCELKNKNPVYDYSNFFDFDSKGRMKGHYTPYGFFEPD